MAKDSDRVPITKAALDKIVGEGDEAMDAGIAARKKEEEEALKERYIRQWEIVPMGRLRELVIAVIGVGAGGRQVALQLAAMGTRELHLIDPDVVELHNVATQGYPECEVGNPKVDVTQEHCYELVDGDSGVVYAYVCRFEGLEGYAGATRAREADVVFCCVDSIEARGRIYRMVKEQGKCKLWIDGRMSAEVVRILTADMSIKQHKAAYQKSLFKPEEAVEERCTARTTIYSSNIAAGLMVGQLVKWLRGGGLPLPIDISFNLLTMELGVVE